MTDNTQEQLDIARNLGLSAEAVAQAQRMSPSEAAQFLGQSEHALIEQFTVTVPDDYPSDGTVSDVLDWVGDDPQRAEQALGIENGKDEPRKTLVAQLEKVKESSDG